MTLIIMIRSVILSDIYAESRYVDCHYDEFRYADCRGAFL
jgi:hypothetical protein